MLELCRNFFITLVKTFFPFSADILIRSAKFQIWFHGIIYYILWVRYSIPQNIHGWIMCKQLLGLRAHPVSLHFLISSHLTKETDVVGRLTLFHQRRISFKSISTDVTRLVSPIFFTRNYTILNTKHIERYLKINFINRITKNNIPL